MTTPTVSSLKGTGYNQIQFPRLSSEQQQLFSQVMGGASPGITAGLGNLSQLAAGGSPEYWKQLEAPAMRQFGELQGDIASRFSGAGTGARRSSGFQNTMGGASADLAERLQSQRLGLQQNAISQLMGLYGNLMGTEMYDTYLTPEKKKLSKWRQLLGAGLPIGGGILGGLLGGPMGAGLGSTLGGGLGKAFLGDEGAGQMDFSGIGSLPTKWGS